ncbi:MAG: hypothetical protein ACKOWQ_07650 [Aquirufa sp.]
MSKKAFIFTILLFMIGLNAYSMGFPHKLYPAKVIKKVSFQILRKVHK